MSTLFISGPYLQKEHVYSTFHSDLYCCFYNGHRHSSRLNKIKERLSLPSIQVFHQEINIKGSAIFTKNLRPLGYSCWKPLLKSSLMTNLKKNEREKFPFLWCPQILSLWSTQGTHTCVSESDWDIKEECV